jgi:hypothetical protein
MFLALALLHGMILAAWPSLPVIAAGVWWNSNTISHNFIHRPFFPQRWQNRLFSAYLTALLGIPQALWRERHLAHHLGANHAGARWRVRVTPQIMMETLLVVSMWSVLVAVAPRFFFGVYVPGYAAGLALCALQGHYEHAAGVVSHYGTLYNFLCFNDGFHAEHHAYPGVAWRDLPSRAAGGARTSRWPALLRWLDAFSLEGMERLVLRSTRLQHFVLARHGRAIARVLTGVRADDVAIVGGGLYPRSALILRGLLPDARITVVDQNWEHVEMARGYLPEEIGFANRHFDAGERADCDLLVIPLSFQGNREQVYQRPPARMVLVHDWIWRRRGVSRVVSVLLLKRVNLITP